MPIYRELAPAADLSGIACHWVATGDERPHRVLPDGCVDLLWRVDEEQLWVVGTMTRAIVVPAAPASRWIGVRLVPGAAANLLRTRADALTEQREDAAAVLGAPGLRLIAALRACDSIAQARRELEGFVRGRPQSADARVRQMCAVLEREPSSRVDALAREIGLSRQHARRLFTEHVGIGPKAFARIVRMRRAVTLLREQRPVAEVAGAAGYADQAHLTREIRALVGTTPAALRDRAPFVQDPAPLGV
jgi:AraC-like DNA-binding protein